MNVNRVPGVGSSTQYDFRQIMAAGRPQYLPGGIVIDGDKARDPLHTSYVDTLRAGLLMGKITSGGLWAPSVIGVSSEAMTGDETEMDVSVATATEIVRRIGSSGTFSLVGPPTAAGVVRKVAVTYSACVASTGKITISAMGTAAVWTITTSAAIDQGTFKIAVDTSANRTTALAYNVSAADMQTALRLLTGCSTVTVALAGTVYTVTFPLTTGDHSLEIVEDNCSDANGTPIAHAMALAQTAVGVDGQMVAGALIMPDDGSETIRGIMGMESGLKVTDDDGTTNLDVECSRFIIGCSEGGVIDASQIINYPADASLKAYVKAALRATGSGYVFDDDYNA